jgi:N utilization substance protein A
MPIQARTEFAAAINQIASEKGVETEVIIDAIKQAALAAYRKDLSFRNESIPEDFEELVSKLDPSSGEITIWRGETNITPPGFARIAAQTAKQVITQKLHEAEKGAIISEYEQKVGTVVSGAIQRQEGNTYFVDIGRAEGLLPPPEQSRDEFYTQNQRLKFFIKEIRETSRGPEVIVSRTDAGLVKGLFAMEVPEIQSGVVEIKEIAREAGGRCKVAVVSSQDGVDPVGSMVGQKGVRVQAVINELGEEKIDIISYSDEPKKFIASALSPAKDVEVSLDEETKVATVKVPDGQLSLAIGKGGQNVRLAAKLTGWKIDIVGLGDSAEAIEKAKAEEDAKNEAAEEAAPAEEVKTEEQSSETPAESVEASDKEGTDEANEAVSADAPTDDNVIASKASQSGLETQNQDSEVAAAPQNDNETEGVAEESDFDKMEKEKIVKEGAAEPAIEGGEAVTEGAAPAEETAETSEEKPEA